MGERSRGIFEKKKKNQTHVHVNQVLDVHVRVKGIRPHPVIKL